LISGWGCGGGNSSLNYRPFDDKDKVAFRTFLGEAADIWADPTWRTLIVAGVLTLFVVGIVLLWVFSRGQFVFLEAVARDRKAIVEPWRTYREQGNSLFLWRLLFSLAFFGCFLLVLAAVFYAGFHGRIPTSMEDVAWVPLVLIVVSVWLPAVLISIYLTHFLHHFIVPIMYRDRLKTNAAWRKFLPLFTRRPFAFLLYGLFVFGLHILLSIATVVAMCLTCCLLLCVLVIPFVGVVALLPVHYTLRGLGPEFLRQFGDEYSLWPHIPPEAIPPT
jgi:hypothetical protein